jgi:hypothetical protein
MTARRTQLIVALLAGGALAFAAPYTLPTGTSLADSVVRFAVMVSVAGVAYTLAGLAIRVGSRSRDIPER